MVAGALMARCGGELPQEISALIADAGMFLQYSKLRTWYMVLAILDLESDNRVHELMSVAISKLRPNFGNGAVHKLYKLDLRLISKEKWAQAWTAVLGECNKGENVSQELADAIIAKHGLYTIKPEAEEVPQDVPAPTSISASSGSRWTLASVYTFQETAVLDALPKV